MTDATHTAARRYLAIGGRLMIQPNGQLVFGLDAAALFAIGLTVRQRTRRVRITRVIRALSWQRPDDLAALVRQHGAPAGGWIVWEGC